MRINAYLLIDSHGAIEVRKKLPAPHLRQVSIRVSIEISDTWFQRPIPSVTIAVPDDHVLPAIAVQTEPLEDA